MSCNRVEVLEIDTGEVTIHAAGDPGGNYGTLCGVSTSDDLFKALSYCPRGRINCQDCWLVFKLAKTFRTSDFSCAARD